MNTLANEWLKEIKVENISLSSSSEEEEGAVGGAKAEIKETPPMSMEMFLHWMMMEKQERKEELKRMEKERKEQEEEWRKEKEEQREKEEKKEQERKEELDRMERMRKEELNREKE